MSCLANLSWRRTTPPDTSLLLLKQEGSNFRWGISFALQKWSQKGSNSLLGTGQCTCCLAVQWYPRTCRQDIVLPLLKLQHSNFRLDRWFELLKPTQQGSNTLLDSCRCMLPRRGQWIRRTYHLGSWWGSLRLPNKTVPLGKLFELLTWMLRDSSTPPDNSRCTLTLAARLHHHTSPLDTPPASQTWSQRCSSTQLGTDLCMSCLANLSWRRTTPPDTSLLLLKQEGSNFRWGISFALQKWSQKGRSSLLDTAQCTCCLAVQWYPRTCPLGSSWRTRKLRGSTFLSGKWSVWPKLSQNYRNTQSGNHQSTLML